MRIIIVSLIFILCAVDACMKSESRVISFHPKLVPLDERKIEEGARALARAGEEQAANDRNETTKSASEESSSTEDLPSNQFVGTIGGSTFIFQTSMEPF